MKPFFCYCAFFLAIFATAKAQSRLNRLYNMGDTLPPFPSSFCFDILPETNQFIIAGDNYSPTRTAYVAGFDYNGTQLWQKDLHFAGNFNISPGPSTMIRLSEGTNVMLGSELDLQINPHIVVEQPYLYFFNHHGDSIRFTKSVDSFESRRTLSLTKTTDNYLVAAGIAYSKSVHYDAGQQLWISDSTSCYVARYDTLGQLIWERRLLKTKNGSGGLSIAKKVIAGEHGSIIIAGLATITALAAPENYSHFVTKLDSSGNTLWFRNYRYNQYDEWEGLYGIDLTPARNGDFYFLAGRSIVPKDDPRSGPQSNVLYYGRCNTNGDTLWTKTFSRPIGAGGYEWTEGCAIRQDNDGNLLLGGFVYYNGNRPTLVIADSNGRVRSFRQYKYLNYGPVSQNIYDVCRTPTKQILIGGTVSNNDLANWDSLGAYSWLVQTDSLGCLEDGCADADTVWNQTVSIRSAAAYNSISIFPNPAGNFIRVRGIDNYHDTGIEIIDLQGRKVISQKLRGAQNEVNLQHLPPGTYLIMVYRNGDRQAIRFVKT